MPPVNLQKKGDILEKIPFEMEQPRTCAAGCSLDKLRYLLFVLCSTSQCLPLWRQRGHPLRPRTRSVIQKRSGEMLLKNSAVCWDDIIRGRAPLL